MTTQTEPILMQPETQTPTAAPAATGAPGELTAIAAVTRLGEATGCAVWTPGRGETVLAEISLPERAQATLRDLQVVWVHGGRVVGAFGAVPPDAIELGLLRLADAVLEVGEADLPLYAVVDPEALDDLARVIERPVFQAIGLAARMRFVDVAAIAELLDRVRGLEGHLSPSVIDTAVIEQSAA